jgi:drug/metabolite transporter (DMT)-like permease
LPTAERSLPSSPPRFTFSWSMFIGTTSLAHLAKFQGFSQLYDSIVAATLFIQLLPATLLAIVLLKGQPTFMTIIGGLLIIVSVYMISRKCYVQ